MFSWLKKKKVNEVKAVVKGRVKRLEDVSDQVFSKGLIGRGVAILPEDGKIYAPVSGTLSVVFPTGHAFGIQCEDGSEYLIHIGIDTVSLKGEGFQLHVAQDDVVEQGRLLATVDFPLIEQKGFQTDTMVLVTTAETSCTMTLNVNGNDAVDHKTTLFTCEMN